MRAVLIVPNLALETVARGLVEVAPPAPSVVAVLAPLEEAGACVVVFRDLEGQALDLDLDQVAAHMSFGGHDVGVAHGMGAEEGRRWLCFREGKVIRSLDPRDELYLPVDEDGFPDLERTPVRQADGPPPGWGRFRTCHDVGMKQTFSCRFGPVEHLLATLQAGQDVGARAFALVNDHRRLHPPLPLAWGGDGRPR